MNSLRQYVSRQLEPFNKNALWSVKHFRDGVYVFLGWFIPSCLLVGMSGWYGDSMPKEYLKMAASEGIGPHLWNVIGTLACLLSGMVFLFPRQDFLARWTTNVLVNTFSIGGLGFGILTGQLIASLPSMNFDDWRAYLMAAGISILFVQVLLINFSLWLAGGLFSPDVNLQFRSALACVDWKARWVAGAFLAGMPIVLLWREG